MSNYPELFLAIGDTRISASSRETLLVTDPATGAHLGALPCANSRDVERAIAAAEAAFLTWSQMSPTARSDAMMRVAQGIDAAREQLATIICLDLGKPRTEALVEVDTAAGMWRWNAEETRRLYGRVIPARRTDLLQTALKVPVGPVAAFAPWNAPLVTPSRKISSALGAGCSIVLKAAEEVPGPAVALMRIIDEAGIPAGTVNLLFGNPPAICDQLLASGVIRAVTFTGSTHVGRQVAIAAMGSFKRVVMELGGHAPVIVTADCDITQVAKLSVRGKFRNAGQICTSPTRFLIERDAYDAFAETFVTEMQNLKVGPYTDTGSEMGPLVNDRRVQAIASLIEDARQQGVQVETGSVGSNSGSFHAPTAILNATPVLRAMNEEPFGPLALLAPFDNLDDAIAEANRLPVGLAAYAFTTRIETSRRLAAQVRAGNVILNHFQVSLPETPFGGVGDSGLGSEGGSEGVAAFLDTKYVSEALL